MKKRIAWVTLSLLIVVALVLSSCQPETVEEEKETEEVVGQVIEKEAAKVEEEEEKETVTEEKGPEMVLDVKGRLVDKPRYGGTLTTRISENAYGWDPWWDQHGGANYKVFACIYERLTRYDWSTGPEQRPAGMTYIPPETVTGMSAESWEHPDPLTYVIHLKKGMHFWNKPPVNGREVTADDWKYSIERTMGIGEWEEHGVSPYTGYSSWELVESVEVVGKYTFIMHLKEPSELFPEFWGAEVGPWLHPHEVVEEYGDRWEWEQTVGSGPFIVEDVIEDSMVSYRKFDQYHDVDDNFPENRIPYVDRVKLLYIVDWSTTLAALRTGKIDVLAVGWEDAKTLQETNPELKWTTTLGGAVGLAVNTAVEPYSDIRVRRAMQMAINLPEMAETYYGGTADPYPYMISKAFTKYWVPMEELSEECAEAFVYNPERARELLAEAGYPNGFKQVIPTTVPWDFYDLMVAYWAEVGIETEIRLMEQAAYGAYVYAINPGRSLAYWWCAGADWHPLQILSYVVHGQETHVWNLADVDDPYINERYDKINIEPDPAERDRMYKEAFLYATCQHYQISAPVQMGYVFWHPWMKGYWGQDGMIAIGTGANYARYWIDEDLKFEMTGIRD